MFPLGAGVWDLGSWPWDLALGGIFILYSFSGGIFSLGILLWVGSLFYTVLVAGSLSPGTKYIILHRCYGPEDPITLMYFNARSLGGMGGGPIQDLFLNSILLGV